MTQTRLVTQQKRIVRILTSIHLRILILEKTVQENVGYVLIIERGNIIDMKATIWIQESNELFWVNLENKSGWVNMVINALKEEDKKWREYEYDEQTEETKVQGF